MRNRFPVSVSCLIALITALAAAPLPVCTFQSACAEEIATTRTTTIKSATKKNISFASLEKYPTVTVTVNEDGKDKEFRGVPLRTLLAEMIPGSTGSMPEWKSLAKKELVMEVRGDDGYPGLVTAAEVAINESGDRFILATHENGKPISNGVRMICKLDEHHVRWVHSIVSLRIAGVKK